MYLKYIKILSINDFFPNSYHMNPYSQRHCVCDLVHVQRPILKVFPQVQRSTNGCLFISEELEDYLLYKPPVDLNVSRLVAFY